MLSIVMYPVLTLQCAVDSSSKHAQVSYLFQRCTYSSILIRGSGE